MKTENGKRKIRRGAGLDGAAPLVIKGGMKTEKRTMTMTMTVNAPAVRLIATESLVNVAGPRLMARLFVNDINPHTLNTLNTKL